MRTRPLKAKFFKNENIAACKFETRLLLQGLWLSADKLGRLEDRPARIKSEVFPHDQVEVDAMLEELQARFLILRYKVGRSKFIQIFNFQRNANPHKDEATFDCPPPSSEVLKKFIEDSGEILAGSEEAKKFLELFLAQKEKEEEEHKEEEEEKQSEKKLESSLNGKPHEDKAEPVLARPEPKQGDLTDEGLAGHYCFVSTRHTPVVEKNPAEVTKKIHELRRLGVQPRPIFFEIYRIKRDREEWFDDFRNRLLGKKTLGTSDGFDSELQRVLGEKRKAPT